MSDDGKRFTCKNCGKSYEEHLSGRAYDGRFGNECGGYEELIAEQGGAMKELMERMADAVRGHTQAVEYEPRPHIGGFYWRCICGVSGKTDTRYESDLAIKKHLLEIQKPILEEAIAGREAAVREQVIRMLEGVQTDCANRVDRGNIIDRVRLLSPTHAQAVERTYTKAEVLRLMQRAVEGRAIRIYDGASVTVPIEPLEHILAAYLAEKGRE